jgi:hypothetical protein
MTKQLLSASGLLAARVRTTDGEAAPIDDLLLGTDAWMLRFLLADAAPRAPGRRSVVSAAAVGAVDEGGEVRLRIDAAALAGLPTIDTEAVVVSFAQAVSMQAVLNGTAEARSQPRQVSDKTSPRIDAGARAGAPPEGDNHGAAGGTTSDLISLSALLTFGVETADGAPVRLMDALLDRDDWRLVYLELSVGPDASRRIAERVRTATRCLLPMRDIDWLHRDARMLYLAVWADELRRARLSKHPADATGDRVIHVLPD